ncbi:hypothetical protein BC831DRAFT_463437 [Entophlyctis helioformis]|nr:hypothetical protein BC831DRAFT_463437 [Entophlyctis helioformis]
MAVWMWLWTCGQSGCCERVLLCVPSVCQARPQRQHRHCHDWQAARTAVRCGHCGGGWWQVKQAVRRAVRQPPRQCRRRRLQQRSLTHSLTHSPAVPIAAVTCASSWQVRPVGHITFHSTAAGAQRNTQRMPRAAQSSSESTNSLLLAPFAPAPVDAAGLALPLALAAPAADPAPAPDPAALLPLASPLSELLAFLAGAAAGSSTSSSPSPSLSSRRLDLRFFLDELSLPPASSSPELW